MEKLYFKQLLAGKDFAQKNHFAGHMENFVYLIGDNETKECVVIDPAWGISEIIDIAQKDDMKITGALATHYHPDHIGGDIMGHNIEGLAELQAQNPCKVHAHKLEKAGILELTGLSDSDIVAHESGDRVKVGDIDIELVHTPGHTPGSLCFKLKDALVSGDTLFLGGCGRVDLPGGDSEALYHSVTSTLAKMPDEMVLFPGHNYGGKNAPFSSVKSTNPLLRVKNLKTWNRLFK